MQISENDIISKEQPAIWPISQLRDFTNPNGYLWVQSPSSYLKYIFSGNLKSIQDRVCSSASFQYLPQFSLYPNRNNVKDCTIVNLFQVIQIMQSSHLKDKARQIKEARELGDEVRRANLKAQLPYITHSGIFIPRRNDGLYLPGFTFQLDIDKITNPQEILQKVIADKELTVLFATIGASGNGVKAMLFLKELMFLRDTWTHEQYSKAYRQVTDILKTYFLEKYKVRIDEHMKAISQPFFLFYSADLYVHKNLKR